MRYAIYWLPLYGTSLYQKGQDWFEQNGKFKTLIETHKDNLSYYDFTTALSIPQKYGFHAEILPPFYLKHSISEYEIFETCHSVAKDISVFDMKLQLTTKGKSLKLYSVYKNNAIDNLRKKIHEKLLKIADFTNIFNFETQSFECCQNGFQITLSNTTDILLQNDLEKIAKIYWEDLIKNFIEIKHFNLCYQKNENMPFLPLTRFSFTASKTLPCNNKSVRCV